MTPEQRYLFDINGYLHIPNLLSDNELAAARAAIDRYTSTTDDALPEGFSRSEDSKNYENGFAFDKALEALTLHPGLWPIIKEFTHDRPALTRGTLLVDSHEHEPLRLHCAREDFGWQSMRYDTREGRIFCDDFVIFPYFDDVFPATAACWWSQARIRRPSPDRPNYSIAGQPPNSKTCPPEWSM